MGLDDDIAEAARLARRKSEVHEATELLLPLAKRFRDVLATLRHATESESESENENEGEGVARETRERAEKILEQAVRTLVYVVGRQKALPLASRVLEAESLARAVVELHGVKNENGEVVGGLDSVLVALGERVDENTWHRQLEQEKREHVDLLRESIREVREVLEADESMARETIVLLKHAQAYGRWNALADELWAVVEPFATRMDNQDHLLEVPASYIPESDIVFRSRMLDRGGFATIHNAVWDGCSVVVKVAINIHQTKQLKQLATEVEIGYGLSHPHVIKMYGACHTRSPPLIVDEFAKYGNMSDYLHRYGEKAPKWRLLYEAALGLQFLHRNKIIHGDMKLNNILITADGTAKVGDFGLCGINVSPTISALNEDVIGGDGDDAIRCRAPECFRTKPMFASDVYSFGMCIYEVVAGVIPYEEVSSNREVQRMICEGELPRRPSSVDDEVWDLIVRMTRSDPESRSSLRSVVSSLRGLSSRDDVCPSGVFFSSVDGALVRTSAVSSLSTKVYDKSDEIVETEIFGSVSEAVEVLHLTQDSNRQLRALKWVFRNGIRSTTYSQLCKEGGIPVIKRIAENVEAPFAFDLLDSVNNSELSGSLTFYVNELKAALSNSDELELSTLYGQMADEAPRRSREAQLEVIEVFSICCGRNVLDTEIDVDHFVSELLRLLKVDDAQVNAAVAYALGYISNGPNVPKNSLLGESIGPLVALLASSELRSTQCASYALADLAANSFENRATIAMADAIVPLVKLLKTGSDDCVEQVVRAICNVAINSLESKEAIAKAGGIAPLVEVLKTGSVTCNEYTALALGNVACNCEENSVAISKACGITPLVKLLTIGSGACKVTAALALDNVAGSAPETRNAIAKAGGIAPLVELLKTGSAACKETAVYALGNLACGADEIRVAIANAGGICPLVELLETGSQECKYRAARALSVISLESSIAKEIVDTGAVPVLSRLCDGGCVGEHAKTTLENLGYGGIWRIFAYWI